MKIQIVLIIVISIFFSCSTNPSAVRSWFPDDIIHPPAIVEFINNFSTDDIYVARTAYLSVLTFIKELITAHHENLARAYRFDTPTVKRPVLISGKLTIIESAVPVSYLVRWDDDLEQIVEVGPSGDVFTEFVQILHNSSLYNKLLDHWFSLTGELLGEHIDVESVWDKLLEEHKPLYSPTLSVP
jgi:hypothetical protein